MHGHHIPPAWTAYATDMLIIYGSCGQRIPHMWTAYAAHMDGVYLTHGQRMPHAVDRIPRYIVDKIRLSFRPLDSL